MPEQTIRLRTPIPGPESVRWMERRRASVPKGLSHASAVFIESGSGATVIDVDGNRLLDFAGGLGCLNVGHTAAPVASAIQRQSERYLHACFHVTPNDGYVRLAEALNARTPGHFAKKTMLVSSGAEAVENAVKIARAYTRRSAVIAFEDAFHGRTLLGMSLTSKTHPYKAGFGPFAPEIYRMPYAYCYRCPYTLSRADCGVACANRLRDTFRRVVAAESGAAVIVEPVLGEGGFVNPPREFLQGLASICREQGVVLIVDEVQTGFGRTGTLFASEQFGLEPDLLLAGKSLASGLPMAAVTGRAEIMDAADEGGLGGTYGGNPLACEAALAVLETFDAERLEERATAIGEMFERYTRNWPGRSRLIGDIRGLGAMRAIELVRDRSTREPAPEETARVIRGCNARGLLVLSAGTFGNVIRLLVPLVATDSQIREGLAVLEEALREEAGGPVGAEAPPVDASSVA
ncbi:MAG: 4-aminobutyrate--2-oxoglutarate transaminase [Vicinamibacterales bacterium]